MKKLLILLVLLTAACQSEQAPEPASGANATPATGTTPAGQSGGSAQVTMEGKSHQLNDIDWKKSKVEFNGPDIVVNLVQDGSPLEINFALYDSNSLKSGSGTFTLPAEEKEDVNISLNFKDRSRRGIAVNQRVHFSEGTIEVQQVNEHSLKFSFKGQGHPAMDKKPFPIEGSVDLSF